ncbi:galactose mutarotase [Leptobacterium flavescens]|uniref:Aldose 1-epimerase n=1 Tax=Leptobacterium flavescens TaxID=472055 RepID=A0A6P0UG06_9FLAO|nr:aldose epimerase family protein [Leptobacterium flavescens]NER12211.1 galactose mutarotase [Leptobacterium flavescens]
MILEDFRQITIQNKQGLQLTVLNYGAIIKELMVPDKNGKPVNVVIGYKNPSDYLQNYSYMGACIGRYAGRISNGSFSLNGMVYQLHKEEGIHLHGGQNGFDKKFWFIDDVSEGEDPYVKLSCISKDKEEGYPGNLKAELTYQLTEKNELKITHSAICDRDTIVNLTNHSYFNLSEYLDIGGHELSINASKYLEIKENLLPTGKLKSVGKTDLDFRKIKEIGDLKMDNTFVLDDPEKVAVSLYSPGTGIEMSLKTNQPSVVVYTPKTFGGICFEAQNYPDAPNHDHFPSALLRPGEFYTNEAVFSFNIR